MNASLKRLQHRFLLLGALVLALVIVYSAVETFKKPTSSFSQTTTVKIYPLDNVSGPVPHYGERSTTCSDSISTGGCYDSEPWRTDYVYDTEGDGTTTYRQSAGAWYSDSTGQLCTGEGASTRCCSCQDRDWKAVRDSTRNHPTAASNWAQQSITIPAGIGRITKVKFYEVNGVPNGGGFVVALFNRWDGAYTTGRIGAAPVLSKTNGVVEATPADWYVTPGQKYYVRIYHGSGTLSIPLSSGCGGGCSWTIDWGGAKNVGSDKPHSSVDVYLSGEAYAGNSVGANLNEGAANFHGLYANRTADLARMAVWGETIPPTPTSTPTPTPVVPTLGALNISHYSAGSSVAGGTYGTAGLRTSDGGLNYYNGLIVKQNVTNVSGAALVGSAFTNKTPAFVPANSTLYELTRSAYSDNGFVVIYANQAKSNVSYYNGSGSSTTSFTAGGYYAYYGGSWSPSRDAGDAWNFESGSGSNKITYMRLNIPSGSEQTAPSAPQFAVTLFRAVGDHTWGTYSYVMSTGGTETAVSQAPQP